MMRRSLLTVVPCVALVLGVVHSVPAQMYANRTLFPVALDDTTRSAGFFPGITYFADIQRSAGSAGDDRAWTIRLAGTAELWRFGQRTSLFISAADEVAANAMKDGGFNPRGISWELGLGLVRRFGWGDWQLAFVHYCRHEIDNTDHPGLEPDPAGYVPTKRTMSANGPRSTFILRPIALGTVAGRRLRLRGAVAGETYHHKWDGRQGPDTTLAMSRESWMRAQGASSGALRLEAELTPRTTAFLRASGIAVWFGGDPASAIPSAARSNQRIEVGSRMLGSGGTIEVYGALERVFDDVMTPAPRPSRAAGIGVRLAGLNHF